MNKELEKSFNEIKEIVKSLEIELNFEKEKNAKLERKIERLVQEGKRSK